MQKKILFLTFLTLLTNSQEDGNPHGWDRQRRCDNEFYSPPCGPCEGIGGLVTSDAKKDIKITTCSVIALPSELDEKARTEYPLLPDNFINDKFWQILISVKTNVLCVGGFPGPDSTQTNCYQEQKGIHYMDWAGRQVRFDLSGKLGPFSTPTVVYHRKQFMWIDNTLPVIGSKQCICTDPGASQGLIIYPIHPDFMKEDSRFIGRERLGIEYMNVEKVVDHWTKGPHHIWKDVETGRIIRMWQPWNGLQVLHPDAWRSMGEEEIKRVFDMPPKACLNGYFKTNCDANGYPKPKKVEGVKLLTE